ncbi:MAG: 50S ribosomal protein L23 [Sphingobacteriia bacterium]|nr:50S ribosomal protein L23 [Sphingobacteriia bacterium]
MITNTVYDVIVKPLVTEKSDSLNSLNKYVFEVSPTSTKKHIKKAVEAIFNVSVEKVNIVNLKGKIKIFRGRTGKRNDKKKAIITLKQGDTIDFTGEIK